MKSLTRMCEKDVDDQEVGNKARVASDRYSDSNRDIDGIDDDGAFGSDINEEGAESEG